MQIRGMKLLRFFFLSLSLVFHKRAPATTFVSSSRVAVASDSETLGGGGGGVSESE